MNKVTTILAILLWSSACHDSVYEQAVASLSDTENSRQEKNQIERLYREIQDLKETLRVIKTKQNMYAAEAEVEANKNLIIEECIVYIKENFNESSPVLYRDYEADIEYRPDDTYRDGDYVGGCRIYLGKARKTGESWRLVPTYLLKDQRKARLQQAQTKRTADKKSKRKK
ncbi:hypothetical protein UFOVP244_108 [uncultured Caudovirales phage]|uniref:Uncharacterized protein n=1 Tax=uncultured Caudovirales phage TaxID=2100421 RepID=A0A6J7WYQ7_9CAUD|nr:hypothetical protein UFOVP244_108 [uncultured Caudovirales phage]